MRKLKILQLQSGTSDSTTVVGRQLGLCLADDHTEVLTAFLSGTAETAPDSQEQSIHLDLPTFALKGVGRWWAIMKLLQLCRTHDFDVLIAHRFKPLHILLTVGRILERPVIGVVHGVGDFDRPYRQSMIRNSVGRGDCAFVAVSDAVRTYLLSLDCGFTRDNTCTISNAVAADEIEACLLTRDQARQELGLAADTFVVGTIGRLVPVKAHRDLVDAFACISGRYPHADLAIIGEGREHAALVEQIKALGLDERVHLLGERQDAARYLRAFDVFALPSHSEGFPLALLEAMAAGLPVVASSIPAITGMVDQLAMLHPAGDSAELAHCLERMIDTPKEERIAQGQALRRHVGTNHGIRAFTAQYQELIEQMSNKTAME